MNRRIKILRLTLTRVFKNALLPPLYYAKLKIEVLEPNKNLNFFTHSANKVRILLDVRP